MISSVASEIKVRQLNFSGEIIRRFASLAMAVEIHERKQCPISKNASHLIDLINTACKSDFPEVKSALKALQLSLDNKSVLVLNGLGAKLESQFNAGLDDIGKKYLRGARS
jgi:hypothetical protein